MPTVNAITWNMQGANGQGANSNKWREDLISLIENQNPDYLCLQECGDLPASANDEPAANTPEVVNIDLVPIRLDVNGPDGEYRFVSWNLGTQKRPEVWYFFWVLSDATGKRVNLAVGCRQFPDSLLYAPPTYYTVRKNGMDEDREGKRPAIGMQVGRFQVWTLHPLSITSNTKVRNESANLVKEIGEGAEDMGCVWASLADFNASPRALAEALEDTDYQVFPPNADTRITGKLDYMVLCSDLRSSRGQVDRTFVRSDHYPVAYAIDLPFQILQQPQ